jgi:hypothetical protein
MDVFRTAIGYPFVGLGARAIIAEGHLRLSPEPEFIPVGVLWSIMLLLLMAA